MTVRVRGARKAFPGGPARRGGSPTVALAGVDLDVAEGELVVLVGASGSGKTTLLRVIAGLESLDAGTVEVGGRDVTRRLPGERDVAMVFQEHALYPHLSVGDNIGFGLRARNVARDDAARKVREAAAHLGIGHLLERHPAQLSGGERQRVGLARAIVREPAVFLLDEPLSNLDPELRAAARAEIRGLQRRLATSMLYVTHDQVEAMTLGDRVAVLRDGRVEQVGPPAELYDRPSTTYVATLFGSPPMNLVPPAALGVTGDGLVGVRAERLRLVPDVGPGAGPGPGAAAPGERLRIRGTVTHVEPIGADALVHVAAGGPASAAQTLVVRVERRQLRAVAGDPVGLSFDDSDLHRFPG